MLFARAVHLARDLGFAVGPMTRTRLDDRYLDTSVGEFELARIALRLRRSDHGRTLTVKSRGAPPDTGAKRNLGRFSVRVDDEFEVDWDGSVPASLDDLPPSVVDRLPVDSDRPLHEVLRLQQVRYEAAVSTDGSDGTGSLCVDRIQRPYQQRRVELEVPSWNDAWHEFADRLAVELRLHPIDEDKLATARAKITTPTSRTATRIEPPQRNKAAAEDPAERRAAAEPTTNWLTGWLLAPLDQHLKFTDRIIEDPRPKRIRRFRVACRHLRTRLLILDQAEPLRGRRRPMRFLRARARQLGRVRDLDVTLERLDILDPDEERFLPEAHERLRQRLERLRAQAARKTVAKLQNGRSEARVQHIREWLQSILDRPTDLKIEELARSSMPAAVENLRSACERSLRTGRIEDIHSARLRVKRLRYICRAFRGAYDIESVERALVPAQDCLGALQDAETTRATILRFVRKEPAGSKPFFESDEDLLVLGAFLQRETDRIAIALDDASRVLADLSRRDWSIFEPNRWPSRVDL
ncbi:MAG: CHAD domain-containing protein [Planctomycetota bacterium]